MNDSLLICVLVLQSLGITVGSEQKMLITILIESVKRFIMYLLKVRLARLRRPFASTETQSLNKEVRNDKDCGARSSSGQPKLYYEDIYDTLFASMDDHPGLKTPFLKLVCDDKSLRLPRTLVLRLKIYADVIIVHGFIRKHADRINHSTVIYDSYYNTHTHFTSPSSGEQKTVTPDDIIYIVQYVGHHIDVFYK